MVGQQKITKLSATVVQCGTGLDFVRFGDAGSGQTLIVENSWTDYLSPDRGQVLQGGRKGSSKTGFHSLDYLIGQGKGLVLPTTNNK